jgi:hypothetical protein
VRTAALVFAFLAFVVVAACGSNPPARLVTHFDAGADGGPGDAALDTASGDAALPVDAGPYLGGPCVDDGQCDDSIPCTYDSCDKSLARCRNVPDSTQCQDGTYCNGVEQCVPGHGCEPGPVVACDDGNACHIARCDEATKNCVYVTRDADLDGDPDGHCPNGHDCNDLNPNVSSIHAEVCANGVDDNCNGFIDEQPCVVPQGQTCAGAVATTGAGTYSMSTVGANHVFTTSCTVGSSAMPNVVAAITVPPGPNVDLEVWANASLPVAVAIDAQCDVPTSELACASGGTSSSVRVRARNVAPGTYYAVVATAGYGTFEIQVAFLTPTPAPTDVDCATATPVQPGTPVTVSLVDAPTNLATTCASGAGELTYSFTLAQPQDVRVFASTVKGGGTPVVGLRDPACTAATDEMTCAQLGGGGSLYARAAAPGAYVVTVGATSPIDESFVVQVSPPTTPPADQTCVSPPALAPNTVQSFDLANHAQAIKDGCATNGPTAAYDLSLAQASDVLLIARIPQNEAAYLSLDLPACDVNGVLGCSGSVTPVRIGKRNASAGDYRAVVSDVLGQQGTLEALVRPTVAPTILPAGSADTCSQALDVSAGGFFTGDTSTANSDYGNGCDAPGQPPGGAPDQVLTMTLKQQQRVILDMEGSSYETILDVRGGLPCPGAPLPNDCYVGFYSPERSFLDLTLDAGTYWIIVDGYQGQKGPWGLDVRVLPP